MVEIDDPFYRYIFYNTTEDLCVSTVLVNRGQYAKFLSNRGPNITLSNEDFITLPLYVKACDLQPFAMVPRPRTSSV